jgi:hypothetical protein
VKELQFSEVQGVLQLLDVSSGNCVLVVSDQLFNYFFQKIPCALLRDTQPGRTLEKHRRRRQRGLGTELGNFRIFLLKRSLQRDDLRGERKRLEFLEKSQDVLFLVLEFLIENLALLLPVENGLLERSERVFEGENLLVLLVHLSDQRGNDKFGAFLHLEKKTSGENEEKEFFGELVFFGFNRGWQCGLGAARDQGSEDLCGSQIHGAAVRG